MFCSGAGPVGSPFRFSLLLSATARKISSSLSFRSRCSALSVAAAAARLAFSASSSRFASAAA